MPIFTIRQFQCPECHYIKNLRNDEDIQICPACGNGLPNNQRTSGLGSYKGHTQVSYRDGSKRPTCEEIDEDIRTGKKVDETGMLWN